MSTKTIYPAKPGNCAGVMPEFGRAGDVQRLYGLKRGTLYNLLAERKIRGVLLRIRGTKSGVRLFDMASIGNYIRREMKTAQEDKS